MKPARETSAFLYAEFHVFLYRRGGRDREHSLAHAGNGEHGALSGDVDERLFAVRSDNTEGFDVGSVSPYIRDDSDERYQRFFIHSNLHFAARRHK